MMKLVESYLTAATAAAVGLLSLFDVVDAQTVSAATLATLALVAFHLATRRPASSDVALLAPPGRGAEGGPSIHAADDIRIIGVTLNRTIRNHLQELEHRLAQGARVQVAIIDPAGAVPREAARRCAVPDDARVFEHRLRPTLDHLRYLQERSSRVEVRLLPFVPAYGLFMIDPGTARGSITVDIYSHRPSGQELVLTLRSNLHRHWYEHFNSEFDRIWASGRPIQVRDEPSAPVTTGRWHL
jgi:hypothetical protein